jgi:hypothetical protein
VATPLRERSTSSDPPFDAPLTGVFMNERKYPRIKTGSISVDWYMMDLLSALRMWHGRSAVFNVEQLGPGRYRVEAEDGFRIIVDSRSRMVDDSCIGIVPPGFPGRIEPEHSFQVSWKDANGREIVQWCEASSPVLARQLMKAPASATATEMD